MKHLIILILVSICTGVLKAQSGRQIPGPANLDTAQLSRVYFLRDKPDEFPDNWLGVVINNHHGMCVKAKMNSITIVHTSLTGPTRFHTKINEAVDEVTLDLMPGHSYYVELNPIRTSGQAILGDLNILEEDVAKARIQHFTSSIQDRYCILPFDENANFVENVYSDTVRWFAAENFEYHFLPLPSWEVVLESTLQTVFSFRNTLLSTTYSEIGGIRYELLKKCKSADEFDTYCREEFIPSTLKKKHDQLMYAEVKPIDHPSNMDYANLVVIENTSENEEISPNKALLIRSVYIVFFWRDAEGKGHSACFYNSERGLPEELHTLISLEEEMLRAWSSFHLEAK